MMLVKLTQHEECVDMEKRRASQMLNAKNGPLTIFNLLNAKNYDDIVE